LAKNWRGHDVLVFCWADVRRVLADYYVGAACCNLHDPCDRKPEAVEENFKAGEEKMSEGQKDLLYSLTSGE
jgi:benzoyl-CoA reductase/2-hydroxyglutaryl-CoA dehydratase subunit BcrC/BadD/HgdB